MAGVRLAILNQQQIGVHHEHRRRKVQQKNFVGQSEKLSVTSVLESGSEKPLLICGELSANQAGQILFTVTTVMWVPFATISGDTFVLSWEC